MRLTALGLMLALGLGPIACSGRAQTPPRPRVIDLGHPLGETDPTWSGERVFTHVLDDGRAKGGWLSGQFSSDEHFGTHVDAPAHFGPGGLTVDKIPADRLVRSAVCVDVRQQVARSDDYQVTRADLQAFERDRGSIPEGSVVFIATGWDARWPDQRRYMNERDGVKHFPGLSTEAAAFLARDRKVAGIGIDTPSIDYGPSAAFDAHHTTQPLGVYHIENAANLTSLPATGFTVVVAPIDIKDGSGGPARVFALVQDK